MNCHLFLLVDFDPVICLLSSLSDPPIDAGVDPSTTGGTLRLKRRGHDAGDDRS